VDAKARFAFPGSVSRNDALVMSQFTLQAAVSSRTFLASARNLSYPACLVAQVPIYGTRVSRVALPFRFDDVDDEQQVLPLRSPGFPVKLGGVDDTSCALLYGRAHTWTCPEQRGRKSGYAPVGMTLLVFYQELTKERAGGPEANHQYGRDDTSVIYSKACTAPWPRSCSARSMKPRSAATVRPSGSSITQYSPLLSRLIMRRPGPGAAVIMARSEPTWLHWRLPAGRGCGRSAAA
jgi:hypothetical protein